jgi:hypothetical protein
MSFHNIIRRAEEPARADQSAVGAINRPLLWSDDVVKPHNVCPYNHLVGADIHCAAKLAKFLLQNLACCRHGQSRAEFYVARVLIVGHILFRPGD